MSCRRRFWHVSITKMISLTARRRPIRESKMYVWCILRFKIFTIPLLKHDKSRVMGVHDFTLFSFRQHHSYLQCTTPSRRLDDPWQRAPRRFADLSNASVCCFKNVWANFQRLTYVSISIYICISIHTYKHMYMCVCLHVNMFCSFRKAHIQLNVHKTQLCIFASWNIYLTPRSARQLGGECVGRPCLRQPRRGVEGDLSVAHERLSTRKTSTATAVIVAASCQAVRGTL